MAAKRSKPVYYGANRQLNETQTKAAYVIAESGVTFEEHEEDRAIHTTPQERAEFRSKQNGYIEADCHTASDSSYKQIAVPPESVLKGQVFVITYISGNTANAPTVSFNGGANYPVFLSGGRPSGAVGSGSAYCDAGNEMIYYFTGTRLLQFGCICQPQNPPGNLKQNPATGMS